MRLLSLVPVYLLALGISAFETDAPSVYALNGNLVAAGLNDVTITASVGTTSLSALLTALTNLQNTETNLTSALTRITALENAFALVLAALSPSVPPTSTNLVNVVQLQSQANTQATSILKLVNAASSSTPPNENSLYSLASVVSTVNSKAAQSDLQLIVNNMSPTGSTSNLINVPALQSTVTNQSSTITKLVNAASTTSPGNENNLWSITTLSNSLVSTQITVTSQSTTLNSQGTSITSLTTSVNTAQNNIASQMISTNALSSQLTSAQSSISIINGNLTSLLSRLNTDEFTLSSHSVQLSTLSSNVTTMSSSINSLSSRLTTDEANIATVTSASSTATTNIASLSSQLLSAQSSIGALTMTTTTLTSNMSSVATDISNVYQCSSSSLIASKSARSSNNVAGCVAWALPTLVAANCTSSSVGIIRYNANAHGIDVCTGTAFLSSAYVPLGSLITRPATSCQSIVNAGDAAGNGYYWLGTTTNPIYTYCLMTSTTGVSLGGNGLTVASASSSCANLYSLFNQTAAQLYWIALSSTITDQVYCNAGTTVTTSGVYSGFPATSCDAIRQYFGTSAGLYYIAVLGQVYCDTTKVPAVTWTNGASSATTNPISCKALKVFFTATTSGVYWLYTSGVSVQAYCDMSSGSGWTLIMKLGGNAMCWGSGIWTSGVAYNPSSLLDPSYPSGYDAKSQLFDAMSDVASLKFSNSLASTTVTFASNSSPRTLMTTTTVPFSPYPNYASWRAVFSQDRANAPIFMRGGAPDSGNYASTFSCPRATPSATPRGCGQVCMFCFQASDDCCQNYVQPTTGCYANAAGNGGGYNDVSSGLGLSSAYCGGGQSSSCSWQGSWSTQGAPVAVYAQ